MEISTDQRLKTAQLLGSWYFIVLGLVNFGATAWNVGGLRALDVIILAVSVLPLLVNTKMFSLLFGVVAGLISLYIGYACLMFNLTPGIQTSQMAFFMGYLLAASTLTASILLLYSSQSSSKETRLA